jgi:hypothetical protein
MKWALVVWVVSANNFTVFDKFDTVEQCLNKREVVVAAFDQVNSKYNAVCRPIKNGGEKSNSNIVVYRATVY